MVLNPGSDMRRSELLGSKAVEVFLLRQYRDLHKLRLKQHRDSKKRIVSPIRRINRPAGSQKGTTVNALNNIT